MIDKLRRHYGSALTTNAAIAGDAAYYWYTDTHNQVIGIQKERITPQEAALLDTLLTPLAVEALHLSAEQRFWQQMLFQDSTDLSGLRQATKHVRFLHFSLKEPFFERTALEEALHGLLEAEFVLVWRDAVSGVIVELYSYGEEDYAVSEDAFQTLTSDFFITPHILIGRLLPADSSIIEAFHYEQMCFQIARQYMKKQFMYRLEDTLPFLFMEGDARQAAQSVLQGVAGDQELLATIRVYLECNMNISLAAKQLYMHRNSVLYRVDKFAEKTGIDIKTFKGAVAVYLALLLHE